MDIIGRVEILATGTVCMYHYERRHERCEGYVCRSVFAAPMELVRMDAIVRICTSNAMHDELHRL